jgi:activator of 2-hydroxyglutaryl-CoA dehydratase
MRIAGIDLGSGTTKCVLIDERGTVVGRGQARTKADFEKVANDALGAALFALERAQAGAVAVAGRA